MRGRPFIAGDPRTVACSRQGCAVGHQQALLRHARGLTQARRRTRQNTPKYRKLDTQYGIVIH